MIYLQKRKKNVEDLDPFDIRYQGFNCDGTQPINSLCFAEDTGEVFSAVDPHYIMQNSHLETDYWHPDSYRLTVGYSNSSTSIWYPETNDVKASSSIKSIWVHFLYYFEENENQGIDWGAKYYPNYPRDKITALFNPQVSEVSGTIFDYFQDNPKAEAPFISGYSPGTGGDNITRYTGFYLVPVSLTSISGSYVDVPTDENPWTLNFHLYVEGLWDQDFNLTIHK